MSVRCVVCRKPVPKAEKAVFDTRFGIDALYGVTRCPSCGLEQTFPAPSQGELKRLYAEHYNFSGLSGTAYTGMRERFLFSPLYRLWLLMDGDISFHGRKGRGRLLDIGCNEGRGLMMCRNNGWDAEGIELNGAAAKAAQSRGFKVHTGTIEGFYPEAPYDAAVLSNVLEHSTDPKGTLSHVSRVLKPGGQVWISCPNSRSWLRAVFGRRWINWHVPFHIAHFSGDTLCALLELSGFKVVEIRHRTPALWAAHSVISSLFARKGRPTKEFRNALLVASLTLSIRGLFFPALWLGNALGRGDCLVVTAEKCCRPARS